MPLPKKKVGAALGESDGRRRASEAGRALVQRPRRDRGIAAKQCRSSQPAKSIGQIGGDGVDFGTARRPRGHRAGARQARVLTAVSRRSEASLRIAGRVCAAFSGAKAKIPFLPRSLKFKNGYFQRGFCLRLGL